MKYFTPELWASWGAPGHTAPPPEQDPFRLYFAELETLRSRLEPSAFQFFAKADVHDGELLEFVVVDGSRPSPAAEPVRPWLSRNDFPVTARLQVLDAWSKLVWTIRYSGIRRLSVNLVGEAPPHEGGGFGDWGYHELSDAGDSFLRHEVLFASNSTLLVEFRAVEIRSEGRGAAEQRDAADKT